MIVTPTAPAPSAAPVRGLGRVMLALRLAAGQSVEQVAGLYGVGVARVRRRARDILLQALVAGMRDVMKLPAAHRLLRLAGIAAYSLACQVRGGHAQAIAFAERCWARRRDPGLVVALMAQRLLARLERLPEGVPPPRTLRPRVAGTRRAGGFAALTPLDREILAYARFLRDATLTGAGTLLRYERQQIEAAPQAEREALALAIRREIDAYQPHPERAPSDAYGLLMPLLPPHLVHDTAHLRPRPG